MEVEARLETGSSPGLSWSQSRSPERGRDPSHTPQRSLVVVVVGFISKGADLQLDPRLMELGGSLPPEG